MSRAADPVENVSTSTPPPSTFFEPVFAKTSSCPPTRLELGDPVLFILQPPFPNTLVVIEPGRNQGPPRHALAGSNARPNDSVRDAQAGEEVR